LRCLTVPDAHRHHHYHHDHHRKSGFASRREFISSLLSAFVLAPYAFGQERSSDPTSLAEQFRRISEQAELEGLAAPYRGIGPGTAMEQGLFQIAPTGVSTEPVRNAAERFIASLTSVQLARSTFSVDDVQWRKWMNQHFYVRAGVSFQEMTDAQRD